MDVVTLALLEDEISEVAPELIAEATDDWLEENVAQETGYVLDSTLTMSNAAAPADKVGELKTALTADINTKTNLYDSSANTSGGCLRENGTVRATTNYVITDFMSVEPDKYTYSYYGLGIAHNYAYTCFYDADKNLLSNASVCLYGRTGLTEYSITVPETARYVKFSLYTGSTNTFQFYQIYNKVSIYTQLENLREENRLYKKTALFFGDSICNGSSADDNKGGYAGRIGDANEMTYYNYGYNGATVAPISEHHSILTDVVGAVSTYPTADFIILEGGTNDADILDSEGLGTFTANDYSGSYDTTTFSGAFETMLYDAITQWRFAHVGYIVAQKMGTGDNYAMRRTFFNRAVELCQKWGVQVIDLWNESKLNRNLSTQYDSSKTGAGNIEALNMYTDGQHLTPTGYDYITPIIADWMQGI